ncbi:arginine--tRNA ligase [Paenibacillus sp. 1P07SE]|uniref:arginine--tRNA ligase n=1 Tax=Paenibacillus sp. 1P07SE TaxID=3132209 RepID=UPI0039A5C38F
MNNMTEHIAAALAGHMEGVDAQQIEGMLELPADPGHGDLSLPCFKLSKQLRRPPQQIADKLAGILKDEFIVEARAVSGYLNIYLNRERFAVKLLEEMEGMGAAYGSADAGNGQTVVIDYSSPNIAKPFHIAHLRSTVIGQSLYRILAFRGYTCVGVNHLGDWGTQFGKLLAAYEHWGNEDRIASGGMEELLRLYVRFHEEAESAPELEEEARAWFVRLEKGEPAVRDRWKWFVEISLEAFQSIYELLGIRFDAYTGESFYNEKLNAVLQQLKKQGLLEEDDGAQVVRLDEYSMPPVLMLKSDGSSLYPTRDITAAIYRKHRYNSSKLIYVTDYSQSLHFQQWFKVIERMGCDWADELVHVPFGRISFQGEGLSTRKGNVVRLEDVLRQAVHKTETIMAARDPQMTDERRIAARAVGVGAVIFHDLSRSRMHDVAFDWEHVLNFEGETGPYVQYTFARACRLLQRAGNERRGSADEQVKSNEEPAAHLTDESAWVLLKLLQRFPERIAQAEHKLEPSIVSRTLIELAQAFNHFYHHCPVFTATGAVREARIRLVRATARTLKTGLYLIGLASPKEI